MGRFESKKRYSKITYIKRVKLIELIEKQGLGVTKAARQLRIKIPTAKVILRNYRKKGRIYIKKSDKTVASPQPKPETSQIKEEYIEEERIEPTNQFLHLSPYQFYPYLNWSFLNPYGGVMMF